MVEHHICDQRQILFCTQHKKLLSAGLPQLQDKFSYVAFRECLFKMWFLLFLFIWSRRFNSLFLFVFPSLFFQCQRETFLQDVQNGVKHWQNETTALIGWEIGMDQPLNLMGKFSFTAPGIYHKCFDTMDLHQIKISNVWEPYFWLWYFPTKHSGCVLTVLGSIFLTKIREMHTG